MGNLSAYFDVVPFCPKAGVGLGIPHQHVNVLQHLLGYLKEHIDKLDREEMVETIEQYRQGLETLVQPPIGCGTRRPSTADRRVMYVEGDEPSGMPRRVESRIVSQPQVLAQP